MQEQKKYKIEDVEHYKFDSYLKGEEKTCILLNRPHGKLIQINLFFDSTANKSFSPYAVGKWRIKQQNLKQSKN